MSSISNIFANELALLLFNNTDIPNVGDVAGIQNSASAGNLYVNLHTADPGDSGISTTSQAAYPPYATVAVPRTALGWTVSLRAVTNAADIVFPTRNNSETEVITHWSIVKEAAGASDILFKGALTDPLSVTLNIAPRITAGSLDINF
jgi:hypothetical protein